MKSFQCDKCASVFIEQYMLNDHMKNVHSEKKLDEDIQVFHIILRPKYDFTLKKSIFLDFRIFYLPDCAGLWLHQKKKFQLIVIQDKFYTY